MEVNTIKQDAPRRSLRIIPQESAHDRQWLFHWSVRNRRGPFKNVTPAGLDRSIANLSPDAESHATLIYRPDSLFRLNEIGSPINTMCTRIPCIIPRYWYGPMK